MKYQVVFNNNFQEFIKQVNVALAEGWRPQGGIEVALDASGHAGYFQAMVLAGSNQ